MRRNSVTINRYDGLRELTEGEALEASFLSPHLGRWYGVWIDAGWTPEEVAAWWPITRWLTKLPDVAGPLRDYAWTPATVQAMCAGASLIEQATEWVGGDSSNQKEHVDVIIYGWHPDATVSWPGPVERSTLLRTPFVPRDHGRSLAYAVLSDFLAAWHQFWTDGALHSRTEAIQWAHSEANVDKAAIGRVLGLTKQRIGAILKDPTVRGAVDK